MCGRGVEREPVELPLLGGALGEVWDTIDALAHRLDVPWTIVGGQMVLLHGLEHDETPPRVSTDVDAAVDVRADRAALGRLVFTLTSQLGFESAGVSPAGRAYRFHRRVGSATAAPLPRASCRGRGCPSRYISGAALSSKHNNTR